MRTDAYDVFEAESVARPACPHGNRHLEFERPRLGELPARIDLSVRHTPSDSCGVKHFVGVQAFRATGRSPLACRLAARVLSPNGSGRSLVDGQRAEGSSAS